jgi:putative phosphoribosyl transferase
MLFFRNREQAGRQLSLELVRYSSENPVVLGIPRSGVPVAFEVARALNTPLDVFVTQELGVPGHEELAFGAVAEADGCFVDQEVIASVRVSLGEAEMVRRTTAPEVELRARQYRGGKLTPFFEDRTVILIDDGIGSGASMRAALLALRKMRPRCVIAAAPVAARPGCMELRSLVDHLVTLHTTSTFYTVGQFYEKFPPVTDDEVLSLLKISEHFLPEPAAPGGRPAA